MVKFDTLSAQKIISDCWEARNTLNPISAPQELKAALEWVFTQLESGELRIASPGPLNPNLWETAQWLKQAVLLSFRVYDNQVMPSGFTQFYDKVPLKYQNYTQADFEQAGVRVVPPATVRRGTYIGKNVVLMPSYVNIGAYIGEGSMIDTWATVGSCAQIGKNVHLSGGVGIGGVLEPLQANPTIIGDNCFIGARSEIVEGVIVENNCVISMGVYIGQSTKIYDRSTGEIFYGRVPEGSVVVPGSLPSQDKLYNLYCAVIVKKVDAQTRAKTSLNDLLRSDD
jgi:2,3,4,5-tetrahydropyridine-2-carboxylate N-succinyltransferase